MEANNLVDTLGSTTENDSILRSPINGINCDPTCTCDVNSEGNFKRQNQDNVDFHQAVESRVSVVNGHWPCLRRECILNGFHNQEEKDKTKVDSVMNISSSDLLIQCVERCDEGSEIRNSNRHDRQSNSDGTSCVSTVDQSMAITHTIGQSPALIHTVDQSEVPSRPARVEGAVNRCTEEGNPRSSYQLDDAPPVSEERPSGGKSWTRSQVMTFISLAVSTFLDQVSYSVLAPFFPREATDRGVSNFQIGFIFGVFALGNVIFSPIFGKYIPKLGAKFTFVAGLFVVAGCNILFGVCDLITSTLHFVIYCYVIRTVAAVGTAGSMTAALVIIANQFPDHVTQMVGWIETFSGLGYMVGPVIGGFLYELCGRDYKIPFIALGCLNMLCVFFCILLLPASGGDQTQSGSITRFLSIPGVWPVSLVIFAGSASFGFLDPTLSLHVEQFTHSAVIVGLLFLLAGGSYALSSPVWGYLAETFNIPCLLVILGSLMSAGAFLLMGPSPLLDLPNELWILCLSLLLAGTFVSASIISSINYFLVSARENEMPDDLSTKSVVSGVFNSIYALGAFVGPSAGGIAAHEFGFDWSVTALAGVQVLVAMLLALFTMGKYCCRRRSRSNAMTSRLLPPVHQDDLAQDSMEPLLHGHV